MWETRRLHCLDRNWLREFTPKSHGSARQRYLSWTSISSMIGMARWHRGQYEHKCEDTNRHVCIYWFHVLAHATNLQKCFFWITHFKWSTKLYYRQHFQLYGTSSSLALVTACCKTLHCPWHVNQVIEWSKYMLLLQPNTQAVSDGFPPGVSAVQAQELAAKISENERLHMKVKSNFDCTIHVVLHMCSMYEQGSSPCTYVPFGCRCDLSCKLDKCFFLYSAVGGHTEVRTYKVWHAKQD